MFATLLKAFNIDTGASLHTPSVGVALVALLVRVARADGVYDSAEIDQIDRIVMARHGLSLADARALRRQAETLEAEASDTVRLTRAIKAAVPLEERAQVIEALWSVVLEDGQRDDAENSLLRMIAHLLGVNDRESNLARQKALARR